MDTDTGEVGSCQGWGRGSMWEKGDLSKTLDNKK